MRLLIDRGNTSTKLAVANGNEIVHFERLSESWKATLQRLCTNYKLKDCAISTVAGNDPEMLTALEEHQLPTQWLTWETPCPVKAVKAPAGLGADRWAADIAAMGMVPDATLLVVDAGTCLTFDVIGADGTILGGCISPGVQLRLKAMHEHTALLPLLTAEDPKMLLGVDTDTSMQAGAINGVAFEIEGYVRRLMARYPDLHVFLTGGNSFDFPDDIASRIVHDPQLVLKGLMMI